MTHPSKILIVDDEFDIRLTLSTILEGQGYTTTGADCGKDALEVVHQENPDLVLLDIRLPDLNGFEVCHHLRDQPQTALLPVILVTALDPHREKVKGIEAGADDFLTKPINKEELLARVRSLLRIKELHDMVQTQALHLAGWNRELETRLSHESKLAEVARMLGDMAHEMKNWLMPVVTGTGLLHNELQEIFQRLSQKDSPPVQASQRLCNEIVEMISASAKRIQDQARDLANCVKGLSSPPNFLMCTISKIIAQVIDPLHFQAEGKGVTLRTEGLEALPDIEADERRLFNAFFNLVNNALSETPAGGFVCVKGVIAPDRQAVLLSVTDTGSGMAPEVRNSLFTCQGLSTKQTGTGLGLKIVKDVVDSHGGDITVESQEGVGTAFHLRLPVHRPQATEEHSDQIDSERKTGKNSLPSSFVHT